MENVNVKDWFRYHLEKKPNYGKHQNYKNRLQFWLVFAIPPSHLQKPSDVVKILLQKS